MKAVTKIIGFVPAVVASFGILATGCGGGSNGKETAEGTTPGEGTPVSAAADEGSSGVSAAASAPCTADGDCVPATCCHASACVSAAQAPDCAEMMCTEDCRDGTMDCGKGSCACQDGACQVRWRE
jgi:hypothetical protein